MGTCSRESLGSVLPGVFTRDRAHFVQRTRRRNIAVCGKDPWAARNPQKNVRRMMKSSDGKQHLGSALGTTSLPPRDFPGPPPDEGPPLRVLPIGGLGEIGMNCMLIGVNDRYIMIDAGLMFPDFDDHGMQRILPDTAFLHQWKDKIEAVIITHAHEDHIGAMPWVIPALDPDTPIYAASFVMELVRRRMKEYSLYKPQQYHTMSMRHRFQLGPFECEPIRVTHSIPDCCGMVLRCEHGTIVHSGDWKIDENPVDGEIFDREMFEALGQEGVTLFMSDSTNVLSPGRSLSESVVQKNLIQRVLEHNGKGRVISTQFASNLHRLNSIKAAADASGRKLCFQGMSLTTYLEAAWKDGRAPLNPNDLINPSDLNKYDPNEVLIVCTGSQGEERAALNRASHDAANDLKLGATDLILFSSKVIPGNEHAVQEMMNRLSALGVEIEFGRNTQLHASGHAYREELQEVLRLVKPQHFLPVHGEFAFLCAHAQLAQDNGVTFTSVIRNGELLGVADRRNGKTLSLGWRKHSRLEEAARKGPQKQAPLSFAGAIDYKASQDPNALAAYREPVEQFTAWVPQQTSREDTQATSAIKYTQAVATASMQVLGDVKLQEFFNDGNKGTGTASEVEMEMRKRLRTEGIVVIDVDLKRNLHLGDESERYMDARVRVISRGLWVDQNRLLDVIHRSAMTAIQKLTADSPVASVDRVVMRAVRASCFRFNKRHPEVIVLVHEEDPKAAQFLANRSSRRRSSDMASGGRGSSQGGAGRSQGRGGRGGRGGRSGKGRGAAAVQQDAAASEESEDEDGADYIWNEVLRNQPNLPMMPEVLPPIAVPAPPEILERRRARNPRERPDLPVSADLTYD